MLFRSDVVTDQVHGPVPTGPEPTEPGPTGSPAPVTPNAGDEADGAPLVLDVRQLHVYYGDFLAVKGVDLPVPEHEIVAMIGPSGCGKSTVLRCLNRMNDLVEGCRVSGQVSYHGVDLYQRQVDPSEVRRRIGMVFQKPNPFPKSIYDNITFGPRIAGVPKARFDELVETSLRKAALWDEVKDRLRSSEIGRAHV